MRVGKTAEAPIGHAGLGPKRNERTAAWFAGFAPAEAPRYAYAAVYEGAANNDDVHGGTNAAPMIGKLLKDLFKEKEAKAVTAEPAPQADESKPAD